MVPTDDEYAVSYVTRGQLLTATIVLLLFMLYAAAAHAAPVTVNFAAGDIWGSYTYDPTTPGQRGPDDDMVYPNAITAFTIRIGEWTLSGTEGTLRLASERGEFGEAWYNASMWNGPDMQLDLNVWSPTDTIVATEDLAATPDITGADTWREVVLYDEKRTNVAHTAWLTELTTAASVEAKAAAFATPAAPPTTVPEPSTLALLALGLLTAASASRIGTSRIYAP